MKDRVGWLLTVIFIGILVLLFSPVAFAGDGSHIYWVSPNGTASWSDCESATDPGNGNYCSLSTANSNVSAGDTVYLKGGDYSTGINLSGKIGTAVNKIIFQAAAGETPIIKNASGHGLRIYGSDYIRIDGIGFEYTGGLYLMQIIYGSDHNEIVNCDFDGKSNLNARVNMWKGTVGLSDVYAVTHNWIHDTTFHHIGDANYGCSDEGGMQVGIFASPPDNASGNNTIENCVFYAGGHHLLETYSKYNVLRNNFFHNEGWSAGGCSMPVSPRNGLYGNRIIQLYDGSDSGNMHNLLEGNRHGYSSFASDGKQDGNITIASHGNIVRYNDSYYSETFGIYFKAGANSVAVDNRVYNNSLYYNGQDSASYSDSDWRHGIGELCSTGVCHSNVIVNNIVYGSYGGSDIYFPGGRDANDAFINNWITTDGTPQFVDTTIGEADSTTQPDLTLQSGSGAINNGTHLTQANGSGSDSTTLIVDDALYFQDGTWGSSLSNIEADWIAIGTVSNTVQIGSIDYDTNIITLASAMTWNDNDNIWLYKKSDGTIVLHGSAPDIGAYEYVSGISISGDLNADGRVDTEDIQLCVNVILGTETTSSIVARADVNEDGGVNVLDVQGIVNIILE